jgi:hypothetical protein
MTVDFNKTKKLETEEVGIYFGAPADWGHDPGALCSTDGTPEGLIWHHDYGNSSNTREYYFRLDAKHAIKNLNKEKFKKKFPECSK